MPKKMSNLNFWAMKNIGMPIRNKIMSPRTLLEDVNIKNGDWVLDYGCGPGIFIKQIAEKVGNSGQLYALDIHPLALKAVEKLAKKEGFNNIKTILSNGNTKLSDERIDVIIMFDVLHMIKAPEHVLKELARILKPDGMLYLSDHHMKRENIEQLVFNCCSMELVSQSTYVSTFKKTTNKGREEGK